MGESTESVLKSILGGRAMYPIGLICQVQDRAARQLILQLYQENEELRQRLEHPNNIPEPLRVMGRRAVKPVFKSVKSEENIS